MNELKYLEEERKKLWAEITQLKLEIDKKTSDYEKEAKQASRKTSGYRNRSEESYEKIKTFHFDSEQKLTDIQLSYAKLNDLSDEIIAIHDAASKKSDDIADVQIKIDAIDKLFDQRDQLDKKLEQLSEIALEGEESSSKINAVYNGLLQRKKQIDELYFEVIGYEEVDPETEEKTQVSGLKDELEATYTKLANDLEEFKGDLTQIRTNTSEQYADFISSEKESFENLVNGWKQEYSNISQEIKGLLPNALTAGLSHAFSDKREAEMKEELKFRKVFSKSIVGLVAISIIPFIVNVYLFNTGKTLESLIFDIPKIILAVLPLYIPLLWLAYSSNKKANLSKRLIEEYTHKEVLSKTYEGLSKQIEGINNSDTSNELRIKLLYTILEVSSENPGKLISDYNKSDHPLIDALDKSAKLSDAVDNLSKIPGFSKISKILEEKSDSILEKQEQKINEALDSYTTKTPDNESEDKPEPKKSVTNDT